MTTELPSRSDNPLLILVVDPDPAFADQIREALDRPGWQTLVVEDRMAAIAEAERQAPDLMLVDVGLPGASDLLARFARRDGGANTGPGAMALVPAAIYRRVQAADYRADELIAKPFSVDDLTSSVERWFATPAQVTPQSARLSSEDLFGDILAEVETTVEPARPNRGSMDDDLERKLEMTLSGLLEVDKPRQPKAGTSGTKPRRPPAGTGTEIDQLLDKTLGTLAQSRKRRPATPDRTRLDPPATPRAPSPSAPVSVLDDNPDHFATRKIPTMPHLRPPITDTEPDVEESNAGERFGEYALLERIAVGGMAEVWRARRTGVEGFQKTLAIKKILSHLAGTPDIVSMLVDEAKLAAQLSHDNIIQIYDLGKVDDTFFIAMELVDGMDLRSILTAARQRDLPLPIGQALWIAARLAHALDHAHRKQGFDGRDLGIVHRDVSPQNVLIGTEGEIKLCDFGIARAVSRVGNTEMGALKGKLQYMSPEQAWGREVDSRTDIFSLGAVLFEMLTGTKLFAGDSEISVLDAVRDCQVPNPRALRAEIPEDAEAVLLRALAKTPEDRYQRAGDMAADLDDLLRGLEPQPTPAVLAQFVARMSTSGVPEPSPDARPTDTGTTTDTGTQGAILAPPEESQAQAVTEIDGTAKQHQEAAPARSTAAPVPPAESTLDEPAPVTDATAPPRTVDTNRPAELAAEAPVDTAAPIPSTPVTASAAATPDSDTVKDGIDVEPLVPPDDAPGAANTEGEDEGEAAYDLLAEEAPKAKRSPLPWILVALALAGLVVAWFVLQKRGNATPTTQPGTTVPAPVEIPAPVEPATVPEPEAVGDAGDAEAPETQVNPSGTAPAVTVAPADVAVPSTSPATDETTSEEVAESPPALDPDIEQMVSDEIERRAEKLRQDFERERQVLQDELDKARETGLEPEDSATEGETGGDQDPEAESNPPPPGGGE